MGLLEDARAAQEGAATRGVKCLLCPLVSGADPRVRPEERPELGELLGDGSIYASTIIAVLADRGLAVSQAQVGNHRRSHLGMRLR